MLLTRNRGGAQVTGRAFTVTSLFWGPKMWMWEVSLRLLQGHVPGVQQRFLGKDVIPQA